MQLKSRGLGLSMMMASIFGGLFSPDIRQHNEPHYFEYSGIPTEEQLRKRAERKARKKAKKGAIK